MTRKRTRRKVHAGMHPLDAIAACQPFPEHQLTRILTKVHDAFARMRSGDADCAMFDRLATCLNVGLIRAESIGQPAVDVILAGQNAMREADDIYGRHKRYGFTGPGLEAMREAVDLYEQILRLSTPLQMHQAQQEVIRRVTKGHYEQAAHTA